jgi:hypothetical protein
MGEVMNMNEPKNIPEKSPEKNKKRPEIEPPYVPEFEVPDPPVPNQAHTEMSLGNFGPTALDPLGNFDADNGQ